MHTCSTIVNRHSEIHIKSSGSGFVWLRNAFSVLIQSFRTKAKKNSFVHFLCSRSGSGSGFLVSLSLSPSLAPSTSFKTYRMWNYHEMLHLRPNQVHIDYSTTSFQCNSVGLVKNWHKCWTENINDGTWLTCVCAVYILYTIYVFIKCLYTLHT